MENELTHMANTEPCLILPPLKTSSSLSKCHDCLLLSFLALLHPFIYYYYY